MTNLRCLRLCRGWSQEKLAGLLGIHTVTLSRLENGWFARPPAGVEERIQEIFGGEWTFEALMQAAPSPRAPEKAHPASSQNGV